MVFVDDPTWAAILTLALLLIGMLTLDVLLPGKGRGIVFVSVIYVLGLAFVGVAGV